MSYVSKGKELTDGEKETIEAIEDGTYFVYNEVPTGSINSSNTAFELANNPNPDSSLQLTLQGQLLIQGTHYTISGTTITMTTAPQTGMTLNAVFYTVAP